MTTKQYLEQVRSIDIAINRKMDELGDAYADLTRCTGCGMRSTQISIGWQT